MSLPVDSVSPTLIRGSESNRDTRPVYRFNPLSDSRWNSFLWSHPRSSVFHSSAWLEAINRTYGYEPIAFTTCAPGAELRNAVLCCRIDSWLTGRRLVSVPFADHCDVLVDGASDLAAILSALSEELRRDRLSYVGLRPLRPLSFTLGSWSTYTYCFHQIDLSPDIGTLLSNLHKSSTQRRIRRAEREGLTYQEGSTDFLVDAFCRLSLLTRRRHLVPPQSRRWFENLVRCFRGALKIRVAFKGTQPIAAILTLRSKDTLVYKYGCSDARFHALGGMHLLFWKSIEEAKCAGLRSFDLGRSDLDNPGLITFKDRWGASRSALTYLRLSTSAHAAHVLAPTGGGWKERLAKKAIPYLPDCVLSSVGNIIYRHLG